MAPGSIVSEFDWRHLISQSWKTPY